MQWPGGRILQRHELDAFLAQAVSNQLYEPDQLQELKASHVSLTVITISPVFSFVDNSQFRSASHYNFGKMVACYKQHKLRADAKIEFVYSSIYCKPSCSDTLKTPDHELLACKRTKYRVSD